ncbi:MAG: hypothetical protein O2854_09360 [Chloroflexi bacterium]|nr:hypothetical protein [Chloroflexota bacterium]
MTNLSSALERFLTPDELTVLRRAGEVAKQHRRDLYLVGGSVRDFLLGIAPADLDLVAVGIDDRFATALAHDLNGRITARSQFVTAHLKAGKVGIDLAMARSETYERPGALPTLAPAEDIREDLERRDFSVNAMAVSLSKKQWGRLVDPLKGRSDLEKKRLRVLHPKSFQDDATRIFRAVRYAVRLGFALDATTRHVLRRDIGYVDTIGGERVWNELERIFLEPRAVTTIRSAQKLGVLQAIVPGLGIPTSRVGRQPGGETRVKQLLALIAWPLMPIPGMAAVKKRLRLNATLTRVLNDTGSVKELLSVLSSRDVSPSQLYNMLSGFDSDAIHAAAIACDDPDIARLLDYYLSELSDVNPLLDGDDLLELGVPEGPHMGKVLEELLTARLDGLLQTRDDEESFVRKHLKK